MVIKRLRLGYSEMISVLPTVSRVMKNKSTPLVCGMVTTIGHLRSPGTLTTQPLWEEVSRSSRELAKVAMEQTKQSMIFWLIRVSNKLILWPRWSTSPRFIQVIRNTEVTSSKNGTLDKELSMTECGLHTWPNIKLRTPTWVSGHQIYPELLPITQVWSTILTIFWPVIITIHLSVLMSQKVDTSTHTMIIWLLPCLLSSMMVWLSMKMVSNHQLHKWPTMFLNISPSLPESEFQTPRSSSA